MGERYQELMKYASDYWDLTQIGNVLTWDQRTYMPSGGAAIRAEHRATLERMAHEIAISDRTMDALKSAKGEIESLDPNSDEVRIVRWMDARLNKLRRVPAEWMGEFRRTTSLANQAWQKAREESDFSIFEPHLQRVFDMRREFSDFHAPYEHVYDPLLDEFERGMKTSEVKAVFDELRTAQVPLIQEIIERGKNVDTDILQQECEVDKQWDFGMEVLKAIGYDFKHGRLDTTAHPFTITFGIEDVRITTRVDSKYFPMALFGNMHEAGHGMYEQGISKALERTPLADGTSLGIHESQSRMYENLIGRSYSFWKGFYPRFQQIFPSQFAEVDLDSFYRAINKVEPSYIRVEADEATYNLHIMLRFDLEIDVLERKIEVKDLPEAWNQKMGEYLNLTPPNDTMGVLQDIHWSTGYMGYFPTYTIGNLIASQMWLKMEEDLPELDQLVETGKFDSILGWLRENVHQYGSKYEPMEIVQRITGGGLSAKPYLDYLQTKYKDIYQL